MDPINSSNKVSQLKIDKIDTNDWILPVVEFYLKFTLNYTNKSSIIRISFI